MCMVVQLLGFATKESAAALACWLQWLSAMATRDTTTSYAVRLRLHAHNASKVASPDRGALWKARLAWVSSVLGRPSADAEAVLFSDLDVIPLRPYSALLDKACAPDNSPKFTNSWYGTGRPGIGCPTSSLLQPPQVYHLSSDILFMREMPVDTSGRSTSGPLHKCPHRPLPPTGTIGECRILRDPAQQRAHSLAPPGMDPRERCCP